MAQTARGLSQKITQYDELHELDVQFPDLRLTDLPVPRSLAGKDFRHSFDGLTLTLGYHVGEEVVSGRYLQKHLLAFQCLQGYLGL